MKNIKLKCPYCSGSADLEDSIKIYKKSYGMCYLCENYPKCDSYVGVHKGSNIPLGTLADSSLRKLRNQTHLLFDEMWINKPKNYRNSAYKWLAEKLNLTSEVCHIAMFDESTCLKVIKLLKERSL